MSAQDWKWGGARWWKVDFHTHTPASLGDYGRGTDQATLQARSPREWLLDYMRAGIDCVAVTDHNSGEWIDRLKSELELLDDERPEGYGTLVLFPGVEISVNGGVHLLAIFDPAKATSDIDTLLGGVGFHGAKGKSDAFTSKSFVEVVDEIERLDGLAIPAHVDRTRGIFEELAGTTLQQVMDCRSIFAMDVVDPAAAKPQSYVDRKPGWTEVLGSDAHHPPGGPASRYPGSHFTWVKMGTPTLDGLRLALLDGSLSVKRSDAQEGNPNDHAGKVIESIEVRDAKHMGRSETFTLDFNPWLNAIIGGRGTGKSTLIEFLRIAMRRQDEVPAALKDDLAKYAEVSQKRGDEGLLTDETTFVVTYRKDGARFRIQWSPNGDVDPIQEERGDGTWVPTEGDVAQRFPVRIYSQKQIFQLSKDPLALLRIVDEAPEVKRKAWNERRQEEEARFLSLRAKAREMETGLADEPRLRGELDDVTRTLAVYESTGHAEVLKSYQMRRRQQRAVETWEESWAESGERLRALADGLVPSPLDSPSLDTDADADRSLRERAERARTDLEEIRQALTDLAAKADEIRSDWHDDKTESAWEKEVDRALAAYQDLEAKLATEGAGDPSAYGELVQRRHTIQQRLQDLVARREQVGLIRSEASDSLTRLLDIRRALTRERTAFVERVLQSNQYVQIEVLPYGARETVEEELRRLLRREGPVSEKEFGDTGGHGMVGRICAAGPDATRIEGALDAVKNDMLAIVAGTTVSPDYRKPFVDHVRGLPPEALDRLDMWFPEDWLKVEHSVGDTGKGFRPIQEGSPGEKTAALLAFLLSYGEEPLVLDQPEDDLDNRLIYGLIVKQLRAVKRLRQLIVVTHNANIVVNGDAELVVALRPTSGETKQACAASLQQRETRETICEIMEGGLDAFKQRYRRIALEARHV